MKSFVIVLLFFFSGGFLYLSKAQSIRVVDKNNHPVPDAAVMINEIANGKSLLRFTDNLGSVSLSSLSYPLVITIHHLSFIDVNDTLQNATSKPIIQLNSNSVNLQAVSVTSLYAPAIVDNAVYKVDVITREQIDNQASNNLEQLLTQQINMRIDRDQSLPETR